LQEFGEWTASLALLLPSTLPISVLGVEMIEVDKRWFFWISRPKETTPFRLVVSHMLSALVKSRSWEGDILLSSNRENSPRSSQASR
jgi:hypothetical protein